MNTQELAERLHNATVGLEPPPGFAETVLRGGRRRRGRRRMIVAAGVVAAVAGSATVVALRDVPPQVEAADPRLTQPTRGDLAGDQAFLDEAAEAWRDGLPRAPEAASGYYDNPLGEPHVYWAGDTPAGHAAIVLQEVDVHDDAQVPESETGRRTAEGLVAVDPEDGELKLVGTRVVGEPQLGRADYYKFGPEDRTMLVVDEGEPLHYTFDFANELTGTPLEWHPVTPTDGVALVRVPENVNAIVTVAYQGSRPPATVDWSAIPHDFYTKRMAIASRYLQRTLPSPAFRTSFLPWKETWEVGTPLGLSPAERDLLRGRHDNLLLGEPFLYVSEWAIFARLDDGRTVALQEVQSPGDEPELTAVVLHPPDDAATRDPVGAVDRNAVLPVRFHIPAGGGWIVAAQGKALSYRTAPGGEWTNVGRDAALLPDDATEVKVDGQVVTL